MSDMEKSLRTPPIWDDELEEWNATIPIPELAGFDASSEKSVLDRFTQKMGTRSGELSQHDDEGALPAGTFPLIIHNRMRNSDPTRSQQDAIELLLFRRRSMVNAALEAIFNWYTAWSVRSRATPPAFPSSPEDIDDLYPLVDTPEGLGPLIKLEAVHVHESSRGGVSDIGFEFITCWDDEHGLGVLMNRLQCIDLGTADVASSDRYETVLDGTLWKLVAVASA
ncbi:MAG TPA: hypothetical protein DDZ51_02615 [Planctomycetaceae bacterium]|nr:hypothetical protein [Planctomycetaceae bacterium]